MLCMICVVVFPSELFLCFVFCLGRMLQSEIKAIVAKRTSFEYSLLRRVNGENSGAATLGSNKIDFLRYIEYELNLEALRVKRKARLGMGCHHLLC